ncbi:uncharacterized protein [Ambystoma mexicanum]|uniref:uncharacterized protein n=1 Tax=Ambystoma mexicanum TaxID=8296 RepID=UPI0037E97E95
MAVLGESIGNAHFQRPETVTIVCAALKGCQARLPKDAAHSVPGHSGFSGHCSRRLPTAHGGPNRWIFQAVPQNRKAFLQTWRKAFPETPKFREETGSKCDGPSSEGGDDERDSSSGDSDTSGSSCHSPCQTPRTKADITYTSLVFEDKVRNREGGPKRKKFPDYINIDPDKANTEIKPASLAGCSESTEYAHVSQHTEFTSSGPCNTHLSQHT